MNELFELLSIILKILVLVSLTYIAIFYIRKRIKYSQLKKVDDLEIVYSGGATYVHHNDKAGGYLILTKSCLTFEPNLMSKDTNPIIIPINRILSVRTYWTLKVIPTGLAIKLVAGEERFWVYRHSKWARLIKETSRLKHA